MIRSTLIFFLLSTSLWAKISIKGNIQNYANQTVFTYYYLNNTEILLSKSQTDANGNFEIDKKVDYQGVIKMFLPHAKYNAVFFVDNKEVDFQSSVENGMFTFSHFQDEMNQTYLNYQNADTYKAKRKAIEKILELYSSNENYYKQSTTELKSLDNSSGIHIDMYPFLSYYVNILENIIKYDPSNQVDSERVAREILTHLVNDNEFLEQSNLMNQMLNLYLSYEVNKFTTPEEQIAAIRVSIDKALDATVLETSRGQNVLVGFVNILKSYGLDYIAEEYIEKADALTCTITDDLKSTIKATESTKVGATFEDFKFTKAIQGKKSLYDIKSRYKLVIFWGSFCPHCQQERPILSAYYPELKEKGGELITFSIETNAQEYQNFIKGVPGYHDTDFLYWTSPIIFKYGIQGTPSMFLLDENNVIIAKGAKLDFVKDNIQ